MTPRTSRTDESAIACPHCGKAFRLTETIARPLIEAAQAELESEHAERMARIAKREAALKAEQAKTTAALQSVEETVAARVAEQQHKLRMAAEKQAAEKTGVEMKSLRDALADYQKRTKESQSNELALRKKVIALEDRERELEIEKARQLDAERASIRAAAKKELDDHHRLQLAERDKMNSDLKQRLEDMKRKMEQGSQQLQGEVQELDLEATLRGAFPTDTIIAVPKGVHGGDCLQRVSLGTGATAGSILWESKRTKKFSPAWLGKMRGDQRAANADAAILVSAVLPKDLDRFGLVDGVWISDLRSAVPLAISIRELILRVHATRQSETGKQTKMEQLYRYLCGHEFRHRIEQILESYETMRSDLEAEKRALTKHWAKREKQLDMVLQSTSMMYGELQAIAGSALLGIEQLELPDAEE